MNLLEFLKRKILRTGKRARAFLSRVPWGNLIPLTLCLTAAGACFATGAIVIGCLVSGLAGIATVIAWAGKLSVMERYRLWQGLREIRAGKTVSHDVFEAVIAKIKHRAGAT